MMKNEMPKIVLFEDDKLMRQMWEMKRREEDLSTLKVFHSWEDFLTRGNNDDLKDAVVFVGFLYDQVESKYNGVEMAKMLRGRPISKLFGISWVSEYFAGQEHLFTEILSGNLPNVRGLLGLPPQEKPVKVVKLPRPMYVPKTGDYRRWVQ